MKISAIKFVQRDVTLYSAVINAEDLIAKGIVDILTEDNPNGYQREVKKERARDFAVFMQTGISPPSIIVNIRNTKGVVYSDNILEINDDIDLWIVDGQHRIAGLQNLKENSTINLKLIQFPVVITQFSNNLEEAKQFKIINTARQQIKTDLADRILHNITIAEGTKAMLDYTWSKDFDWKSRSIKIIEALSTNPESIWYEKIKFPNQKNKGYFITQGGFTDSLKILLKDGYFMTVDPARIANLVNVFWNAIYDVNPKLFTGNKKIVIQKNIGVFPLHGVLQRILIELHQKGTGFNKGDFLYYVNKIDSLKDESKWLSPTGEITQYFGAKGREGLKLMFIEEIQNNIYKHNNI